MRIRQFPMVTQVVMLLTLVIYVIPLYLLINLAFRRESDVSPALRPTTSPTLGNFSTAWTTGNMGSALINSIVVTLSATLIVLAVGALAAYPLARSTAVWSKAAFYFFMIGLCVPFQLATIPLYLTFRDLGLLGTLQGMIVIYSGTQLPFAVFVYTAFFRNLDRDYEEAAALDGCGSVATWWHIVLPLARPVIGTIGIISAIFVWNDFYIPLFFLTGTRQTLPLALYSFVGEYNNNWNEVFAGLVISSVPLLVVYFVMQRRIIQGFAGGLKA